MIGYVLLVVFAIVIGAIIYQGLKTYVPREVIEAPEGTSIFIKEAKYFSEADSEKKLNLTLKNNGKFSLDGFFIRATNGTEEVATIDLSPYVIEGGTGTGGFVKFGELSKLKPNEERKFVFNFGDSALINSIEIIPVMFEEIDGKKRFVTATKAKVSETLCSPQWVPLWECVKEGTGCLGDLNLNGSIDGEDVSATIALVGKGCDDPDNMPPCENCDAEYNPLADVYSVTQGDDFQDCDITMGDVLRIIQFFNQLKSCGQNYSLTRDTAGCFSDVVVENKSCYYA